MLDFFRGTYSWRKFTNLVDRLPQGSHYRAAILHDREYWKKYIEEFGFPEDQDDDDRNSPGGLSFEGYSPLMARLDDAIDSLQMVAVASISPYTKRKPKIHKVNRPRSALDELRIERDLEAAGRMAAAFGF